MVIQWPSMRMGMATVIKPTARRQMQQAKRLLRFFSVAHSGATAEQDIYTGEREREPCGERFVDLLIHRIDLQEVDDGVDEGKEESDGGTPASGELLGDGVFIGCGIAAAGN